ncbi:MAG: citrate (Si)-synthase, eukaryotic [Bacteroidetes bacterium]|nr:MAG: citrate (Si)-synthase, eukaryotic [Bacteroidota bacterium]REK06599.1 MAG: citrate (Si)-synthase, eukaryotic [Bacteroidota bacterium]REK33365.1 MAG: citrate (Si)-synthase, eukaryotic [Bacteroidota bacterium]REK49833.1 MAG: citrate (Si)-synthase, eukaryotic [Bacteroidota bacterium]
MAAEIKDFVKENGSHVIGQYTIEQVYSGMKGMIGMVTETSKLDPEEGIRFRGYSIPELRQQLPKAVGDGEPLPEGIFYLMLIGEMPTDDDVHYVSNAWARRSNVPKYVFDMLDTLPLSMHPMTQFSMAITAMQKESNFAAAYRKGLNKKEYWDPMYEDVMNLIARLPRVAAYIYRRLYKDGVHIEPDPKLDWAANFAHMLGYDDYDMKRLMRLYLTIHADHEGGNVSAHSTHLVGSALSDAYLSFAAGMNGLAGPLHGLANQEVVRWIMDLRDYYDGVVPTRDQIHEYVVKTIGEGKVVPGYGHAVLRKTDPRFTAQMEFAKKYMPDDVNCKIVHMVYDVVPEILSGIKKIKNPWPNVDAHSGALLIHYGMTEYDFYTVLFGVSRSLGVLASLLWDRALGHPIERPGSVTTEWMKSQVAKAHV